MGRPKKVVPEIKQPEEIPPVVSGSDEKTTTAPINEIDASEICTPLISGMPEMKSGESRHITEIGEPAPDFKLEGNQDSVSIPADKKKRGRPKGAAQKAKEQKGVEAVLAYDPNVPDKYDAAAEMYVEGAIYGLSAGVSAEWMPRTPDEPKQLKRSLAQVMRIKQVEEPPAWIVLLGSVALYAIPRFAMPETKAKVLKLLGRTPPEEITKLENEEKTK